MTKQEFLQMVEDGLGYALSSDYPDIEVMVSTQDPMWKAAYTGRTLKTSEGNIFPVLNLDAMYEELCDLKEYEAIDRLVEASKSAIEQRPQYNFSMDMTDYSAVRENLRLCINSEGNERNLDKIPHVMEGAFPLIAKIQVPDMCRDDSVATITVSNEMLEKLDITPEELIRDAKESCLNVSPLSVMSMPEMLMGWLLKS